MNVKLQIPGLYALCGAFYLLACVSFYVFAINLAHSFDSKVMTNAAFLVIGIIISMGFLGTSFLVFLKARTNKSNPVTILYGSNKNSESDTSQKEIQIEGKNFAVSIQGLAVPMFSVVPIADRSAGDFTWVGGVAIGLAFLFLFVCLYGVYLTLSKSTQGKIQNFGERAE